MKVKKEITCNDFCRMFNIQQNELPEQVLSGLEKVNTKYKELDLKELEEYVLFVLKLIESPYIVRTKEENLKTWEKGWRENLNAIVSDGISGETLKPKYFRPSKFFRYNKKIIISDNPNLEYELFVLARYIIFNKYLSESENIYEFGCGTCQNLFILSEMFRDKKLYGLDWTKSSVDIANLLSKSINNNIEGFVFDMLNPFSGTVLKPGSAVITVHALEQIGTQHDKLLNFIIEAKPDIVVHYEPILEFYDQDNLFDYLALHYSRKRNYLSGFLTVLNKLKEENKIEILEANRPYLGGIIHEASLIAWKPL